MLFNEKYLEQFAFKPEELVANSFEIFIKTPDYEQQLKAIEDIVGKIKSVFQNDPNLESFLSVLRELSGSFKASKTGIAKTSSGYKALEGGNVIPKTGSSLCSAMKSAIAIWETDRTVQTTATSRRTC